MAKKPIGATEVEVTVVYAPNGTIAYIGDKDAKIAEHKRGGGSVKHGIYDTALKMLVAVDE